MTWIQTLQDLMANLELSLPWLLPSLEAVERTVPVSVRLLFFVPMLASWLVLRQRRTVVLSVPGSRHPYLQRR